MNANNALITGQSAHDVVTALRQACDDSQWAEQLGKRAQESAMQAAGVVDDYLVALGLSEKHN